MAPGDAWRKKPDHDAIFNDLRVALNDARIGVAISSEAEPKSVPSFAELKSCTRRQPRRSRTNKVRDTYDDCCDSDGEIRMVCTTDLTGQIAEDKAARKNKEKQKPAAIEAKLNAETPNNLGLTRGEEAPETLALVSWKFLVRYAELYVGKTNTPVVEPYFDEEVVFENQVWDFFYLYQPEDLNAEPLYFVPTSQLETLLSRINEKHGIALKVPDGDYAKFFYKFGSSTPRPRYLIRTTLNVISFKTLSSNLPLPDPEDEILYQLNATQADRDRLAATLKRIKDSWSCSKIGGKSKSKKSALKRYDNRKAWGHATKRIQRYLGLRNRCARVKAFQGQNELLVPTRALDLASPAPFDFENDAVFICFDVETYERVPKLVTEIGFAILDTRDIRGIAPGEDGRAWFASIQARHFRVKEYRYYKNKEFVAGCPEYFQFGQSEIVGIEAIQRACWEVMNPKTPSGEYRKVVLVGHDVAQDIDLILTVDVDVDELPGLLEIIDNQRIQQHRKRFPNPQGLGSVLRELEIEHFYLHNAGNDAVYTLQSMLALTVRMRVNSLSKEPKPGKSHRERPQHINPVDDAGWSTNGEDTDGGDAPPQIDPLAMAKGKVH